MYIKFTRQKGMVLMRKGRIIAWLLSLSMIAGTASVPVYAQTDSMENQAAEAEQELTQEEIDSGFFDSDKSLSKQLERELNKKKNSEDEEAERYFRQRKMQINFLHADEEGEEPPELTDDSAELMADQITVKGTISLPSDVRAETNGRIGVYLVDFDKEGNRVYSTKDYTNYYQILNIAKGASSVTYSITAPKETYALAVCYLDGDGIVLNDTEYYTSNGNTRYQEVADVISASKTVNMTLSKAERVISGTITLEEPAKEDGNIYLTLYNMKNEYYMDTSSFYYYPISKGQTTVDYKIGVKPGVYELYADNGYLTICYDTGDSPNMYIDVTKNSVKNLDFTTDYEQYDDSGETVQTEDAVVTVKLDKPLEEKTMFSVRTDYTVYDEVIDRERTKYYYYYAEGDVGANSVDINVKLRKGESGILCIKNSSRGISYYIGDNSKLVLDKTDASAISSDAGSITVNYPEEIRISGNILRNGAFEGTSIETEVEVRIDEYYSYTYTELEREDDSAEYELYVPAEFAGSSAVIELYNDSYRDSITETQDIVISEDMADVDMKLYQSSNWIKTQGTITIPDGAPDGGMAVALYGSYYPSATGIYAVPKGVKSFDYSEYINIEDYYESGGCELGIRVLCDDSRKEYRDVYDELRQCAGIDPYEERNDYTLKYLDSQITGKITIPENMTADNAIKYEITAECDDYYHYFMTYGSFLKDETEKEYTIYVPSDMMLNELYARVYYPDGRSKTIYYDIESYEFPLKDGLSGADFAIEENVEEPVTKTNTVKGNIIVPSGFSGTAYATVCAGGSRTDLITITEADAGKSVPYIVSLENAVDTSNVYISFSSSSDCNYYTGATYYSENGSVYKSSYASYIEIGDTDVENIDIELIPAVKLSGTISFEEGSYEKIESASLYSVIPDIDIVTGSSSGGSSSGGSSSGGGGSSGGGSSSSNRFYIELYAENGSLSKDLRINNPSFDKPKEFSISVPDTEKDNWNIYVYVYKGSSSTSNVCKGEYYYTGDDMLSYEDEENVKLFSIDESKLNLVIPHGYTISGKINTPEGTTGTIASLSGYAVNNSSRERETLSNVILNADNTYTALLPPISGEYKVTAKITASDYSNIVSKSYTASPASISISGDTKNVDFTLEKGKRVYGDFILPDSAVMTDNTEISIEATDFDTNDYIAGYTFSKNTSYSFVLPADYTGGIKIGYCAEYNNRLYSGWLYYADKPASDENNAARIEIGDGDKKVDLKLVKNKAVIPVKPVRAAYMPKEYDIQTYITAELDNGMKFDTTANIPNGEDNNTSRTLCIPDIAEIDDATSFKLYYKASFENVDTGDYYTNEKAMYINPDGSVTEDADKASSYPIADSKLIKFAVDDGSGSIAEKVASGEISDIDLSQSYISSDDGAVINISAVNNCGAWMNSYAVIAAYDGDRLVDTAVVMVAIPPSNNGTANSTTVYAPIEVDGSYEYKLFLWDNVSKMNPLIEEFVILGIG